MAGSRRLYRQVEDPIGNRWPAEKWGGRRLSTKFVFPRQLWTQLLHTLEYTSHLKIHPNESLKDVLFMSTIELCQKIRNIFLK